MRIITVENEKIAVPSANECVGNTTATIHTKHNKYNLAISYQSSIDTVADKSLYATVIEISLPSYAVGKYNDILTKYHCTIAMDNDKYIIYYHKDSRTIPNVISVYETAISLLVDIIRVDRVHVHKTKNSFKTCISGIDITSGVITSMMGIIGKNNIDVIDFYVKTVCGHRDVVRSVEFRCVMKPYVSEVITISYIPEDELLNIRCTNGYEISINNVSTIGDFDKYMALTTWIFI